MRRISSRYLLRAADGFMIFKESSMIIQGCLVILLYFVASGVFSSSPRGVHGSGGKEQFKSLLYPHRQHRPARFNFVTAHQYQIAKLQQHRFGLGRAQENEIIHVNPD